MPPVSELPVDVERIKHDHFGSISRVRDASGDRTRRDTGDASFGLRLLARMAAAREARALARLRGIEGVPALLAWNGRRLDRAWIENLFSGYSRRFGLA